MSDRDAPPPNQLSDDELLRRLNAPADKLSDDDLLARLNSAQPPSPAPSPSQPGDEGYQFFADQLPATTPPAAGLDDISGHEAGSRHRAFGTPLPPLPGPGRRIAGAFAEGFTEAGEAIDDPVTAPRGTFAYGAAPVVRMARTAMAPLTVPLSGMAAGLEQAQQEAYRSGLPGEVKEALAGATNLAAPVLAPPAVLQGSAEELGAHPVTAEFGTLGALGALPFMPRMAKAVTKGARGLGGPVGRGARTLAESVSGVKRPAAPPHPPAEVFVGERPAFKPESARVAPEPGFTPDIPTKKPFVSEALRPPPEAPPPAAPPPKGPAPTPTPLAFPREQASPKFDADLRAAVEQQRAMDRPTIEWVEPKRHPEMPQGRLVEVATDKLDAALKKTPDLYVGEGGRGRIGGRQEKFREFLKERDGKGIEAGTLALDESGAPVFADGRHRFAEARDQGARSVKVFVEESNVPNVTRDFGAKPPGKPPAEPPTPTPPGGEPPGGTPQIRDRVMFKEDVPKPSFGARVKKKFQGIHDYFEGQAPLGRFEKAVTGKRSETGPRAYAEAFQGKSQYDVENLWTRGTHEGKKVFDSSPEQLLKDVWKKGDTRLLSEYALARRQQSKYAPADLDLGFTSEQARAKIAHVDKRMPHVKAAAEAISKAHHTLWDALHEAGVIPEATWQATRGEFYVPAMRYFGEQTSKVGPKGRNALSQAKSQRVKGGRQPIMDPIPDTFDSLVRKQELLNRGRVGRRVIETYDVAPELAGEFMRELKGKDAAKYDFDALLKQATEKLKEQGVPAAELRAAARELAFKDLADAYKGEHVATHYPGGKRRVFQITDPAMMDALSAGGTEMAKGLNRLLDSKIGKAFTIPTRLMRGGITLPLEFAARQAIAYDPFNALLYDPGSWRTTVPRMLRGMKDATVAGVNEFFRNVLGKKDLFPETALGRIYDEVGPMHFAHLDKVAKQGHTTPKPKTFVGKAARGAKKVGQGLIDSTRLLQEAQQSSMRRVAADALLKEWKKSGEWKPGTPLSMDQNVMLTNASLRLGGSFRLGGKTSGAINRAIAFWKAGERIPVDMIWWAKKNPKKFARRAFVLGVLPQIMEFWKYKDEEWYRDMPKWRRAGLTLNEDITLPAFHPIQLMGVAAKEMLRAAYEGENKEGVMTLLKGIADELPSWMGSIAQMGTELVESGDVGDAMLAGSGNVTPDAAAGLIELGTGKDTFTKRDINPMGSDELAETAPEMVTDERIHPRVEEWSKGLNNALGLKITPLEIDHAFRAYGGTIAKAFTRSGKADPEPRDKPVIGWMYRRIRESQAVSDYYDLLRKYRGRASAMRKSGAAGDREGVKRFRVREKPDVFRRIEKGMRALNDRYRTASVEEKRKIAEKMRDVARRGSEILRGIMGEPE